MTAPVVAEWRPCPVGACEREIRPYQHLCHTDWALVPRWLRADVARNRQPVDVAVRLVEVKLAQGPRRQEARRG